MYGGYFFIENSAEIKESKPEQIKKYDPFKIRCPLRPKVLQIAIINKTYQEKTGDQQQWHNNITYFTDHSMYCQLFIPDQQGLCNKHCCPHDHKCKMNMNNG